MKHLTLLLVYALLAGNAIAAENMTHQEAVVRSAYARFAYSVRQATLGDLALEANGRRVKPENAAKTSAQRLADADLTFTLSNFVGGDIHEILDRKVPDLITPPQDEMLELSLIDGMSYGGARWNSLRLHWVPAPMMTPEAAALTVREALEDGWAEKLPTLLRYVSYTVTVSFQGKSRGPYRAMFVFGRDAQGNETATPLDPNTSNTGLAEALSLDLTPTAFTKTKLRTYPVISTWLNENQMSDAACSASKSDGVSKSDICCDLVKMRCGPSSTDIANDLSKPVLMP